MAGILRRLKSRVGVRGKLRGHRIAFVLSGLFLGALVPSSVAANEPPEVSVSGPSFVPVSSASPRLFLGGSFDHDSPSYTRTLECGSEPPVAFGDWYINGREWFECSMDNAGTHVVGIRAQDSDGNEAAALMEVVATTHIRSIADASVVSVGRTEGRPFGGSLAFVDLNGDGKAELASGVAEPIGQPTQDGTRMVHVLWGRTSGGTFDDQDYAGATGFVLSGTAEEHYFGTSIANAGDVNGDGRQDLIIASSRSGEADEARAYVVYGKPGLTSFTPATMTASQGFRISAPNLGWRLVVAGGGDVNGDGKADLVVGIPYAPVASGPDTEVNRGAAFVIFGKGSRTNVDLDAHDPSTYGLYLPGGPGTSQVGETVALGDVNGDSRADVIMATGEYGGSIAVVLGRPNMARTITVGNLSSGTGFEVTELGRLGRPTVSAGDINGDGKAEVLVASERFIDPYDIRSRVSIIVGKSLPTSVSLQAPPAGAAFEVLMPMDHAVHALSAADWNGDKKADILIGSPGAGDGRGSAYIVPGQGNLVDIRLEQLGSWHRIDGDSQFGTAGEGLAAGDFNGDKRVDIGVGNPWVATEDPFSLGRLGIFFGKHAASDQSAPIAQPPSASLFGAAYMTANPTVRISWPAASDNVGVVRYRLQRKVNSGSWNDVPLRSPGTIATDVALAAGTKRYTFRVRAFDLAGNVSAWKIGPTFVVAKTEENNASINYTGAFTSETLAGASAGQVRWSETEGDRATLTFSGRSVALVTTRGTRGKLRISVVGEGRENIVDLYEYAERPAWIPIAYNLTPGTHTVVVEVLGETNGASGSFRIDIDAFVILK